MTPSCKRISENVETLLAKCHYLMAKSQMDGNLSFDGHKKTIVEQNNECEARIICGQLERAMMYGKEEDIPGMLEYYDLLYRIGYGKIPDRNFIKTMRQRVVAIWERNKREVKESSVYQLLDIEKKDVMRRDWLKTLIRHNRFPGETMMENYRRLTLLMRENLDYALKEVEFYGNHHKFEDSEELKWNLYKANMIDDFSTLSTPLLKVYRSFIASLFPAVLDYEDQQELDTEILTKLLSRPDLPLHDRKAYTLPLSLSTIHTCAS